MTRRVIISTVVLLGLSLPAISLFVMLPIYGCSVGYGMDGCSDVPQALLAFSMWGLVTVIPAVIFFIYFIFHFGIGAITSYRKHHS